MSLWGVYVGGAFVAAVSTFLSEVGKPSQHWLVVRIGCMAALWPVAVAMSLWLAFRKWQSDDA